MPRLDTRYAADIFITNCGGSILWLETDGENAKIQEETNLAGEAPKFGRIYTRPVLYDGDKAFINFRGRKRYMEEFYDRQWGR